MKIIHPSKTVHLITLLIVFCCLGKVGLSQNTDALAAASTPTEKREAEKAWETLIRTKGGREKLYSITNMLTEFSDVTRLHIFPNRSWDFVYDLGDAPSICLSDADKHSSTCVGENQIIDRKVINRRDWITYDDLPFLLETKWDKPEPLRVNRIKEGKRILDVIETTFDKQRLDFMYEPEEMMVLQINFYNEQGKLWQKYNLSDYADINGIKMPQTYAIGYNFDKFENLKHPIPIKFTLNVEYDPQLFERPLKATTPDAWKPQKTANRH